jgi:hypothetical protein
MFRCVQFIGAHTPLQTDPIRCLRKAFFSGTIRYNAVEYIRGCSYFFKAQQPFAKCEGLAVSRVRRFCASKGSTSSSEKFISQLLGVSSCFVLAVVTANAEGHGSDQGAGAQPTRVPENTPLAATNEESAPQHQTVEPAIQLLSFTPDLYSGLAIKASDLPTSPLEFQQRLAASLEAWKAQGKRGIWLTIPSNLVELIPVAVKLG